MELIDPHAPAVPVSGAQADVLAALYRARFPEFVRVATAIAGSADDGYEAVQDAFADVLGRGVAFGENATAGYVWRAVVNAARDSRRRSTRRRRREDADVSASGIAAAERGAGRPEVRAAIAALPERQRLVIFLRYYADLDYDAIALAAGIRKGTVGPTLVKAQAALRRALDPKATT
jgi:RNA polymerase sigma factor (sigma-70 family)